MRRPEPAPIPVDDRQVWIDSNPNILLLDLYSDELQCLFGQFSQWYVLRWVGQSPDLRELEHIVEQCCHSVGCIADMSHVFQGELRVPSP